MQYMPNHAAPPTTSQLNSFSAGEANYFIEFGDAISLPLIFNTQALNDIDTRQHPDRRK
jgi:hypothetical protein